MQLSPRSRPMTPVSIRLTSQRNSKGNIASGGAVWQRGRKNTQFACGYCRGSSGYGRQTRAGCGKKYFLALWVDIIFENGMRWFHSAVCWLGGHQTSQQLVNYLVLLYWIRIRAVLDSVWRALCFLNTMVCFSAICIVGAGKQNPCEAQKFKTKHSEQ